MADCTVLGMPLDVTEDDEIAGCQPLSGFVVVKALGADGQIRYLTAATDGLKSVECLGMARYAVLKLEHGLMREEDRDLSDRCAAGGYRAV